MISTTFILLIEIFEFNSCCMISIHKFRGLRQQIIHFIKSCRINKDINILYKIKERTDLLAYKIITSHIKINEKIVITNKIGTRIYDLLSYKI